MLIKTLLNKVERFKSFVCGSICVMLVDGVEALVVDIEPCSNSRPVCPECGKRRSVYGRQPSAKNLICPYDPAISESIFKEAIHHGIFEKLKIKWLQ